jgi:hypothetical protein
MTITAVDAVVVVVLPGGAWSVVVRCHQLTPREYRIDLVEGGDGRRETGLPRTGHTLGTCPLARPVTVSP